MRQRSTIAFLFTFCLTCIVGISCDEDTIAGYASSKLILDAKKWYGTQSALFMHSATNKLEPDWDNAREQTTKAGVRLVIVPAPGFTLGTDELAVQRGFIFRSKVGKIVDGRIAEFYGEPEYLGRNGYYLYAQYNSRNIDGFSGYILTYNLAYQLLRGRVFEDGKKAAAAAGVLNDTQREIDKKHPSTFREQSEEVCYDW